jgi:cytochrome P450
MFVTTDPAQYRRKRRLVNYVLSDQSMRLFEPSICDNIDIFLRRLLAADQAPLDMTPCCRYLGLDTAGQLGFSYQLKLQTEETYRFLADAITLGSWRNNACMQYTLLAKLRPGPIMDLFPNSLRARLFAMVKLMVASRLSRSSDKSHHDLLSAFEAQSNDSSMELMQDDIWPEGIFFLFCRLVHHSNPRICAGWRANKPNRSR